MTLTETITLLSFGVSLLALLVTVVHVTFEITWKVSHDDQKDKKNKKD